MAGGFNRVTLIGNLGDEPQVRPSQSGTSVATITLAINEYRRDQNGNKTESTEWVRVVAFGKNAESVKKWADNARTPVFPCPLPLQAKFSNAPAHG